MASFPAIEPNARSYGITADLPMVVESAWPSGQVRYRPGYAPTASAAMPLQLAYIDLSETQVQQIRDHYAAQQGGVVPFSLPAVIFQGISAALFPAGILWRYTEPPAEQQKAGSLFDVTVTLESMAYTAVDPA